MLIPAVFLRVVTALLLVLLLPGGESLLTKVAAGEVFIVTEVVPRETGLTFQFNVPNGQFPMQVSLRDPTTGHQWRRWTGIIEGSFVLEASNEVQLVEVVFDNSASSMSHTSINFFFRQHADPHFSATKADLDPIEQRVAALSLSMQRLQSAQVNLRHHEKEHRSTVEDSNTRVLVWAGLQVATLMTVSLFQLYLLKRHLEKKTAI